MIIKQHFDKSTEWSLCDILRIKYEGFIYAMPRGNELILATYNARTRVIVIEKLNHKFSLSYL